MPTKTNEPEFGGGFAIARPPTAACNFALHGSSYPPRPRSYDLPGITIYSYYKHRREFYCSCSIFFLFLL